MRCASAGDARYEKWEARIDCHTGSGWVGSSGCSVDDLTVVNEERRRQRGHRDRWHWDDRGSWRAGRNFTIRERACAFDWNTVLEFRAAFKNVMCPPQRPHAGGKVRIK